MAAERNINGWTVFMKSLRCYLDACGWEVSEHNNDAVLYCNRNDNDKPDNEKLKSFYILPFMCHETLIKIRNINSNYLSPVIFLISRDEWANIIAASKGNKLSMTEYVAYHARKSPEFGDVSQAVLNAELIKKNNEKYLNVFDISKDNFICKLDVLIGEDKSLFWNCSTKHSACREKKLFYDTFIEFYNPFDKIEKNGKFLVKWKMFSEKLGLESQNSEKASDSYASDSLTLANKIYNSLNGIKSDDSHKVKLEQFLAPIPFPLQELIDAKNKIRKELKKGGMDKKIKLLLVDNRSDNKFIKKNGDAFKPKSLCDLLFSEDDGFGLGDIFELQMLGNAVYKKKSGETPQFYKNDNDTALFNYSDFEGEYEKFKFEEFKNKKILEESEKKYHEVFIDTQNESVIKNYADLVYHKIKDADFVLLDFFLNADDTYLAFDFIRDMTYIKRKQGNVSTTWYFITSAMYDSVVKYSQSGLLAEYYESAVVNAGDDPTNKKRQIIFIYKLLTFIQARLKNFEGFKKAFNQSRLFNNKCGGKTDNCKDPHICLYPIQSFCRKYLGEYKEIVNIFPNLKQQEEFKKDVELTDNIINHFLSLPEADWPMIQRQIEHLNIRLEKEASNNSDGTKLEFSCEYILNELRRRSEIY